MRDEHRITGLCGNSDCAGCALCLVCDECKRDYDKAAPEPAPAPAPDTAVESEPEPEPEHKPEPAVYITRLSQRPPSCVPRLQHRGFKGAEWLLAQMPVEVTADDMALWGEFPSPSRLEGETAVRSGTADLELAGFPMTDEAALQGWFRQLQLLHPGCS